MFSYPDLVVYELAGQVHLLGGASDGEDPGVGVGGGRGVPLQLHVSSRLLVNTLNGFTTCAHTHGLTLYYTFNEGSHNVSNLKGQFTQSQKYVSFELFINLDSFSVSCLVLAVETSAFSQK